MLYRKGDYHRYLAEFATGNDRKEAAENSLVAYKAASDIAMTELPPTHPIRLVRIELKLCRGKKWNTSKSYECLNGKLNFVGCPSTGKI